MEEQQEGRRHGLWAGLVKPAAITLGIIILVFIIRSAFNFNSTISWIIIGIASLLWLIYYYKFSLPFDIPKKDEELPDEV